MSCLPDEYSTLMAGLVFVQAVDEDIHESSQVEYVTGTEELHGMRADQETVSQGSKSHNGVILFLHHLQYFQKSQPMGSPVLMVNNYVLNYQTVKKNHNCKNLN